MNAAEGRGHADLLECMGAETVNIEATRNDRAAFCILPMYRRKKE